MPNWTLQRSEQLERGNNANLGRIMLDDHNQGDEGDQSSDNSEEWTKTGWLKYVLDCFKNKDRTALVYTSPDPCCANIF